MFVNEKNKKNDMVYKLEILKIRMCIIQTALYNVYTKYLT